MEQLPDEHDIGVPPAAAERSVRRRDAGMQRLIAESAQSCAVSMLVFFPKTSYGKPMQTPDDHNATRRVLCRFEVHH